MLPYQKHSQTSKQAAQQNTTAATIRKQVLSEIKKSKTKGFISDELCVKLNEMSNNIAPRLTELESNGDIVRLKETRKTRSNRNANIYVCPEFVNGRTTIAKLTATCPTCGSKYNV